jgi:hypothetical protein
MASAIFSLTPIGDNQELTATDGQTKLRHIYFIRLLYLGVINEPNINNQDYAEVGRSRELTL